MKKARPEAQASESVNDAAQQCASMGVDATFPTTPPWPTNPQVGME